MGEYKFRRMTVSDLDFFLSIRNECREYLHDNRIFTKEQSVEWFNKSNPEFYIIEYNDEDIGYFRTSNLTENTIYIGCDIHEDWRGKHLSYMAYVKFMEFISKKYNLDELLLEVLSSNERAHNLYKKLGFVVIGVKKDDIFRNGQFFDSIIMSKKVNTI